MQQGASYVQISVVYIRNLMPDDRAIPSLASPGLIGAGLCGFSKRALAGLFHELVAAEVTEERQIPIP
jgi:hypothetical protein